MNKRFEQLLIEHCAPTLANVKTANMFCYKTGINEIICETISYWNNRLNKFGISIKVLKQFSHQRSYLVYVYREKNLIADLEQAGVKKFLEKYGYNKLTMIEKYLNRLSIHLYDREDFPHEIGLFLGYPLKDVEGFIENKGRNYYCAGCWKVYSNPQLAQKRFERYKKCVEIYKKLHCNGKSITQLTLAA